MAALRILTAGLKSPVSTALGVALLTLAGASWWRGEPLDDRTLELVVMGVGLIVARDANKSSEASGAK